MATGPLTSKQLEFVNALYQGMSRTDAYLAVYNTSNRKTAGDKGSKLANDPRIKSALQRKLDRIDYSHILSHQQVLEQLTITATDPKVSPMHRVRSLELLMKHHERMEEGKETSKSDIVVNVVGLDAQKPAQALGDAEFTVIDHEEQ